MVQRSYVQTLIQRVIANNVILRDKHIDRYGITVMVFTNNNVNNLTSLGEVSIFSERQGHVITILPNFDMSYLLLPFNQKGRADDLSEAKPLEAYVKLNEDINVGDIIEVTYSYFEDTVDRKYYRVGGVSVNSVIDPVSKSISITPHFLPINQTMSQAVDENPLPISNKGFILG